MTRSIRVVKKKTPPAEVAAVPRQNKWSTSFQAWVEQFRNRDPNALTPSFDSLFKEGLPEKRRQRRRKPKTVLSERQRKEVVS